TFAGRVAGRSQLGAGSWEEAAGSSITNYRVRATIYQPRTTRYQLLNALKRRSKERRQMPAVHVFIRSLAGGVMPAGKHHYLVIKSVALELLYHLAREFWQEGEVVLRVYDERSLRPARELAE